MQPSPAPSQPATLKGRFVRFLASDTGLLALLALAKLLIHLLTSGGQRACFHCPQAAPAARPGLAGCDQFPVSEGAA